MNTPFSRRAFLKTSIPAARRPAVQREQPQDFTAEEARFTAKGGALHAFFMGWPEEEIVIAPLAAGSPNVIGKIEHAELSGCPGNLEWKHDGQGLTA